jgi:3-hydroxybutyryl-CoA dehydrogenase
LTEEQAQGAKSKLSFTDDLKKAAAGADLVIEAILEDTKIKNDFFKLLGSIVREDTIIATNSSRMVSSLFKDLVPNPSRLCNLHYFHPAMVMKLTEVVQGAHTSEQTAQAMMDFSKNTGKKPIWLKKEIDGFVVNRLLDGIVKEAFFPGGKRHLHAAGN